MVKRDEKEGLNYKLLAYYRVSILPPNTTDQYPSTKSSKPQHLHPYILHASIINHHHR